MRPYFVAGIAKKEIAFRMNRFRMETYGNYRNGWEMLTKMDVSGKPDRRNSTWVFRIDGNCMESMGTDGNGWKRFLCHQVSERAITNSIGTIVGHSAVPKEL